MTPQEIAEHESSRINYGFDLLSLNDDSYRRGNRTSRRHNFAGISQDARHVSEHDYDCSNELVEEDAMRASLEQHPNSVLSFLIPDKFFGKRGGLSH